MLGAIYARYSEGPRQTDQSIEGQVADCKAFAEEHDIKIVEVYADRHVSGKSLAGRHEFMRMLADAEERRFDCVIVWKIDRFGRDRQDIALSKLQLKKAGVKLMYAKESVPDGPEGIILESLLEGLAEYYSADLRQKVIRGMRESAKKGRYCGTRLPIGYTVDRDKHIVIDPDAAEGVREAFKMHIAGAGAQDIADNFTRLGIRNRRGSTVSRATVRRMLRNENYLGSFELLGIKIPTEPIIDEETFKEAAMHFKTTRNGGVGKAKVEYLLSCKCYCSYCGTMLVGESGKSKTGRIYHYYKCGCKKRGGKCDLKPIGKDHLENRVVKATVDDMLTDDMIDRVTKRVLEIQAEREASDPTALLQKQRDAVKRRTKSIVTAIEEGATNAKALAERLVELEAEDEELLEKIEAIELTEKKQPHLTEKMVKAWLYSFKVRDPEDPKFRSRLVDTFIARVELENGHATIYYNIQDPGNTRKVRIEMPKWTTDRYPNFRTFRNRRLYCTTDCSLTQYAVILF